MRFFDSHAHYDDERFAEEFPGGTEGVLSYIHAQGVQAVCNIGSSLSSSRVSLALAECYAWISAAVGLHPGDVQRLPEDTSLASCIEEIRKLAAHPKACAIGEIGLDYHYDGTDPILQKAFFDAQMSLAEELRKPVIIHDRDAHGDTFDMILAHPNVQGILHSYSGSPEMARQLTDRGWYISFSGTVTYKNAAKVKESCAIVPEDLLLLETDAPYLPPVPHRGKMNHSGYLVYTAAAMAEIRNTTPERIAECTFQNACRAFGLSVSDFPPAD